MTLKQKNRIFIVLVVVTNTVGNLFLAMGLTQTPHFTFGSIPSYIAAFLSNPWIMGGIALMAIWMLSQLSMYTWADLTYVIPVTASAYILTAFLARFVLEEKISTTRWAGIVILSVGVAFVAETPLRTRVPLPGDGR